MALFSRLFGKGKQKEPQKSSECKWPLLEGSVKWNAPDFDPSQIRLIIFKDSISGRTPLFDSKSIKRVNDEESKKCLLRCKTISPDPAQPKFQFTRPGSDTKMLGEMMFGSIAMSYHGSSIKVHSIRYPPQLMFTKILTGSSSSDQNRSPYDVDSFDSYSLQTSFGDVTTQSQIFCKERAGSMELSRSVPVEIPSPLTQKDDLSSSMASSGSFTPIFPSSPSNASSINSASFKSFQKRWQRFQTTSLEYGVRSRLSDPENSGSHSLPTPTRKKSYKIGIGILIPLSNDSKDEKNHEFLELFFSHITLIERHVEKLALQVEKAMEDKKMFFPILTDSLDRFKESLIDLFLTPRLTQTVWLNMMSSQTNRQIVCLQFMTEFTNLVLKHESKDNNFFISTLLTAVLTHHLAWVPTVTPSGVIPSRAYLDKHSAKWLDTMASTHPYNPLWAQLSDLYGAIGFPLKLARTVVVGKNKPLICTLLYVLSYFIRCSEVYERSQIQEPEFLDFKDPVPNELDSVDETEHDVFNSEGSSVTRNLTSSLCEKSDCSTPTVGKNVDIVPTSQTASTSSTNENPFKTASTPSEDTSNEETIDSAVQCKLADTILVPAKVENIQQVRKANPIAADKLVDKTGCSKFYVRLPSNDEAIVSEMDEYFDGEAEVKTSGIFTPKKTCKCGKLTCFKCACKLDSLESIGTSDDAGFVSMESQSEASDVMNDYKVLCSEPRVLSPIHSPRAFSPASIDDVFTDVDSGDLTKRRHPSGDRSAFTRQLSQTSAPGRCKSITPTQLGRRRHVSGGSVDSENPDPLLKLKEVPLPGPERDHTMKEFSRNFGHSLMAGWSDHYLSDFVLHGTSDSKMYQKLQDDLLFSTSVSVLDEPVSEASCVVADVDDLRVYIQNDKLTNPNVNSSQLVSNLVESVTQFWSLRMPPEFCLMHLEDRLQEIYFKSRMLAEYLRLQRKSNICDLTSVLGFDCSDLPLLLAVASTHSPELVFGIT